MRSPRAFLLASLLVALAGFGCRQETDSRETRPAGQETRTRTSELVGDAWITTKVQAQYFADPEVKARRIDVTTKNGVVTLEGRVDTEEARRQAVQIARNTDGVVRVDDRLSVAGTAEAGAPAGTAGEESREPGALIDDGMIETRVRAKFYSSDMLHGEQIDVHARDGVVTLTGKVAGKDQREEAVRLTRETEGVKDVVDELGVLSEAQAEAAPIVAPGKEAAEGRVADDEWIRTKITSSYFLDDLVKSSRIRVEAAGGVVTLSGTAESQEVRQQAVRIARQTEGVKDVIDEIQVQREMREEPRRP